MRDDRRTRLWGSAALVALLAVTGAVLFLVLGSSSGRKVADAGAIPTAPLASATSGLVGVNGAKPQSIWLGDLWMSGVNGGGIAHGIGALAAQQLGYDWQVAAQAQTGWATKGIKGLQGLNTPFTDRIDDALALKPSLIVVGGGANDAAQGTSPDKVKAAVDTVVAKLRAGLPSGSQFFLLGPAWPSLPVPATVKAINKAIKDEAAKLDVPFIDPIGERWITAENVATYEKNGYVTQTGNVALAQLMVADLKRLGLKPPTG